MADSADVNTVWVDQWIAQQRALLERWVPGVAAKGPGEATSAGMAESWAKPWLDLGVAWLGPAQNKQPGSGGAAGTSPPASELFEAWRSALSESLAQAAAPAGLSDMLNRTPLLGPLREQADAWRALTAAQVDCQQLAQEFTAIMRHVQADVLNLLERRIQERREQGTCVQGFRELYDLWIECSEDVFGKVAHSAAYGHLQGKMSNATIRLQACMQKVIEQSMRQFDLPTRSEINSVHQQLRQLRQQVNELQQTAAEQAESTRPAAARRPAVAKRKANKATRPGAQASAAAARKPARASRRSR